MVFIYSNRNILVFCVCKLDEDRFSFVQFNLIGVCSFLVHTTWSSSTTNTAVSSAKVAIVSSFTLGISLVNYRNTTGPNTRPCGIPALICFNVKGDNALW